MISSSPGSDRSRKPSMSSSSKYVPRSAIARSSSRCWPMNSRNACRASSSSTSTSASPSTSRSECAGSSESASTGPGSDSAAAAAQVVLPTPPLPPKNRKRCLAVGDEGIGLAFRTAGHALAVVADVAQATHQGSLADGVVLLADVAGFERHLQLQQLVFDRRVVHHLVFGEVGDLLQAPADAGHGAGYRQQQKLVNDQHSNWRPASSALRRRAPI